MGKWNSPERIAARYNRTTKKDNLNRLLADSDGLFFNHNGITLPGERIGSYYRRSAANEKAMLNELHRLEENLVLFGMQFLPKKSSKPGLDAGCSAGGGSIMIHEKLGLKMEGINLSGDQIKYATLAARKFGISSKVKFWVGDMTNVDRPDNYYSFIWACESSEHVSDLDKMFREFSRITEKGGKIVLIAWIAVDPKLKRTIDASYYTDIHTKKQYLSYAKKNGWKFVKAINLGKNTARYWKLRSQAKHASGSEKFMTPGFASGRLGYWLMVFENTKGKL
jgi:geranyl diphosphate 2-C-methyltransferase